MGEDLMRFFADLGVSPDDLLTLAFAWKVSFPFHSRPYARSI